MHHSRTYTHSHNHLSKSQVNLDDIYIYILTKLDAEVEFVLIC